MRDCVHAGRVEPAKERTVGLRLTLDKVDGSARSLIVNRLHAFLGQRAGVFNGLFADAPEARIDGWIVTVGGSALEHAAWPETLLEAGILWISGVLRLFFGIEVIKVTEEFVEAMNCRQKPVLVTQVVLAELAGRVAERLESFRDGHVLGTETQVGSGQTHLRKSGTQRRLSGDERGAACRTTLLGIVVGEHHAFASDTVYIRRAIAHHTERIGADIGLADIVAHDDEDVGLLPDDPEVVGVSVFGACAIASERNATAVATSAELPSSILRRSRALLVLTPFLSLALLMGNPFSAANSCFKIEP